jgi:hypothetical protein
MSKKPKKFGKKEKTFLVKRVFIGKEMMSAITVFINGLQRNLENLISARIVRQRLRNIIIGLIYLVNIFVTFLIGKDFVLSAIDPLILPLFSEERRMEWQNLMMLR